MQNTRIKEVLLMRPKGWSPRRGYQHRNASFNQTLDTPHSAMTGGRIDSMVFEWTGGRNVEQLQAEAYNYIKRMYEDEQYDHILLQPSGMMYALTAFLAAWQEWQAVTGMMNKSLSLAHLNKRDGTFDEQVWWGRGVL